MTSNNRVLEGTERKIMTSAVLTHVAVLVRSMESAVRYVSELGLEVNPFEEFEHEGTRECYVGSPDKSARLLFLEAIKEGPYKRALEKRGPGLHHLGVWIPNLEEYADQLGSVGWLLHTKSLKSVKKLQTAYFVRPQVPYMIEAWEHSAQVGETSIQSLQMGHPNPILGRYTQALGITNSVLTTTENAQTHLTVEGRQIVLNALTEAE